VTASLPEPVQEVFNRFITTEYVTVDRRGQPIAWPVTPYYRPGEPTIDLTTGVGYPKKAFDARRHPSVALLFSEPTGSGIESGIRVLVQGTAKVDDGDLAANRERYERDSREKLPVLESEQPPKLLKGLFRWYDERIYVEVRPERVFVWPGADPAAEPELHGAHVEEVRSGHSEEPEEPPAPAAGGAIEWDARMDELGGRYPTAVLAWVAPDGFPLAARVPVSPDASARRVRIGDVPDGLPVLEGRACLTAHAHAPDFSWRQNFQVRGDLVRDGGEWSLVPHKLVGGLDLPEESYFARARRALSYTRRFHARRKRVLAERDRR
jgi:hypothetical protein